jgi:hypothetical protein
MKAYGGVDVWIHTFLTSVLFGGKWSASRPGRFTPGTHWVTPRAGLALAYQLNPTGSQKNSY